MSHRPRCSRVNAHDAAPAFLVRLRARHVPRPPRWLDWHFASLAAALVALAMLLWLLSSILAPFLAAAILAYIFDPLVDRLEARGWSRTFGTVVAVVVLLLAIGLLLIIVLPLFYQEVAQLTQMLPSFADRLKSTALPWLNQRLGMELAFDVSSLRQFMQDNLADASGIARKVFATVGSGGLAVVGALVNLLLIPIVLFYVLRDWDRLLAQLDALVPRRYHAATTGIAREIDAVLSEFLRGQLAVMLTMALFYVVGLWLVGLKFALPVGLITGLLVFVPYLGVGMGVVLGTVAAAMQFDSFVGVALVWAVFGAGQVLEGFFVTPKFVGERIGLHPVAVIFALLAFGQVFGFFGVLLALPVSAAILVALRHGRARYLDSSVFHR